MRAPRNSNTFVALAAPVAEPGRTVHTVRATAPITRPFTPPECALGREA